MMLTLVGRLDASHTADLDRRLREMYDAGAVVLTVDLSAVTYVSSSVLRALLLANRRQQQRGGSVRLLHVAPRIMRILTMCGFDRILDVTPAQGTERTH